MGRPKVPDEERFFPRVEPEPNSGCWLWLGPYDKDGYGYCGHAGKMRKAHQVSWLFHRGPIPKGLCVCHTCDTPRCVNPIHLFLGTNAQNLADAARKGRKGGENHGSAKLTQANVDEIRSRSEPARIFAARFGVSLGAIHHVRSRHTWNRRSSLILKSGMPAPT